MMRCWEIEPGKRPSFTALVQILSKSLEQMAGYLHIGAFTSFNEEKTHRAVVGTIADTDCEATMEQAQYSNYDYP